MGKHPCCNRKGMATKAGVFIATLIVLELSTNLSTLTSSLGNYNAASWRDENLPISGYATGYLTSTPSADSAATEPMPIFCLPTNGGCNNQTFLGSKRLVFTGNPHEKRVSWWVTGGVADELVPLAITSMTIRQTKGGMNNTSDHNVDQEWNIFLVDKTDKGGGEWFAWFAKTAIANVTGNNTRLHFVTRTTSNRRNMGAIASMPDSTSFDPFLGNRLNFTAAVFATVTRYFYPVRNDLLAAVDDRLAEMLFENSSSSSDAVNLFRKVDAAHFWNPQMTSNQGRFRATVSAAMQELSSSNNSFSIFTDIVGHRARKGRNGVHLDYVNALLNAKIVVVAQRDTWEDHFRLFEAIVGGAMVMTDPMLDFPHGLVDGESIVVYRSIADLKEKLVFYLHPNKASERIAIARRGREVALSLHRMSHRFEQLLRVSDYTTRVNDYGVSYFNV